MRKFSPFLLIPLFAILFLGAGCVGQSSSVSRQDNVLRVATTFYPIAMMAERIGGEWVAVSTTVPSGSEPHDFEPTIGEISAIYESDVFLYNGGGIDAWASKIISSVEEQGVLTLGVYSVMTDYLLPASEHHHHEDEHGHEEHSDHPEDLEQKASDDGYDEHFWLDPNLLVIQAYAIRDTFIEADQVHADEYTENAKAFVEDLRALDEEFEKGLASCDIRVAVTSHAAFGYLAKAYGFEQLAITGISPDEEPSAGALAELAEEAREQGVSYVFFETLVSPKLAQTLADEINAQTLVFNPLEGLTEEERAQGQDYFSVMRNNLKNLRTAMLCH